MSTDRGCDLSSRQVAAILAALVLVCLLTRLALIDRLPYFIDEGTHARFARLGAHSLHDLFVSLTIGKEPLLIWLGIVWIKLGFNPLTALRLASLISGVLTVPAVAWLGVRVAGRRAGLLAAAGCVVVPFFLVHDVIGIMEPLLTLLTVTALGLQIELARAPRLRTGAGLGLVLGLALLTKESGDLALALMPLSLLCFDWRADGRRRRLIVWGGGALLALALTVGADLLLRSSPYYGALQATRTSSFLYPVHSWHDALLHPLTWWRLAWPIYRSALTGYVGVPVLLVAVAGFVLMARRELRAALLLGSWGVAMFVAAVLFPVSPYPRHVLYLTPLLLIFAGEGTAAAGTWLAACLHGHVRALTLGMILALVAVLAPALGLDARVLGHPATTPYPGRDDVQYVTGPQAGSPWPAVVAAIRARASGSRTIIATDAADPDVVKLLLDDPQRFAFTDGATRLAQRADFVLKDQLPFPDPTAERLISRGGYRLVLRRPRPRGGAVVELYQHP